MLFGFSDVVTHLLRNYRLSGGGPDCVEMWRVLEVDGARVLQHQRVHIAEAPGQLVVIVAADIHCADPERVVARDPRRALGALLLSDGRAMLRQPIIGAALDPTHLDRVIDAVAHEAARLARG